MWTALVSFSPPPPFCREGGRPGEGIFFFIWWVGWSVSTKALSSLSLLTPLDGRSLRLLSDRPSQSPGPSLLQHCTVSNKEQAELHSPPSSSFIVLTPPNSPLFPPHSKVLHNSLVCKVDKPTTVPTSSLLLKQAPPLAPFSGGGGGGGGGGLPPLTRKALAPPTEEEQEEEARESKEGSRGARLGGNTGQTDPGRGGGEERRREGGHNS